MIIPLKVYFFAGGQRAIANLLIRSKELKIFAPVEAIVDTGSPLTILGGNDIKKFRISSLALNKLESRKEPVGLGGGEVKTKILDNTNIKIGSYLECDMPIQVVVENVSGKPQPTVLGVDFLIKNKLSLFFNPDKRVAYFEKEDENLDNSQNNQIINQTPLLVQSV